MLCLCWGRSTKLSKKYPNYRNPRGFTRFADTSWCWAWELRISAVFRRRNNDNLDLFFRWFVKTQFYIYSTLFYHAVNQLSLNTHLGEYFWEPFLNFLNKSKTTGHFDTEYLAKWPSWLINGGDSNHLQVMILQVGYMIVGKSPFFRFSRCFLNVTD